MILCDVRHCVTLCVAELLGFVSYLCYYELMLYYRPLRCRYCVTTDHVLHFGVLLCECVTTSYNSVCHHVYVTLLWVTCVTTYHCMLHCLVLHRHVASGRQPPRISHRPPSTLHVHHHQGELPT